MSASCTTAPSSDGFAPALQLRLIHAHIRGDPSSAEALVSSAGDQLAESLQELRELARGIHPIVLAQGIAFALESLAARAIVPYISRHGRYVAGAATPEGVEARLLLATGGRASGPIQLQGLRG